MPSNKSVPDDDPELQDILMGGGLKEATLKDRKRMLGQFKEFVLKETAGINLEELALNKEGLERLVFQVLSHHGSHCNRGGAGNEEETKAGVCQED